MIVASAVYVIPVYRWARYNSIPDAIFPEQLTRMSVDTVEGAVITAKKETLTRDDGGSSDTSVGFKLPDDFAAGHREAI